MLSFHTWLYSTDYYEKNSIWATLWGSLCTNWGKSWITVLIGRKGKGGRRGRVEEGKNGGGEESSILWQVQRVMFLWFSVYIRLLSIALNLHVFFLLFFVCLFVCLFVYLQEQRRTLTKTGITDVYLSLKEVSQVRLQYSVVVEHGDAWVQGSSPKPISRIAINS